MAAARKRNPAEWLFEIQGYCENSDCNVRYVTVTVKEYDGPTPPHFCCPVCGDDLNVHHIYDLEQAEEVSDRDARVSVNLQLYRRDHPKEPFPMSAMHDGLPSS